MIVHLPLEVAEDFRPAIIPLLAKVARRTNGRYEAEDIFAEVLSGQQTLWVAWDEKRNTIDAAMTTKFVDYPRKRACQVVFVGGAKMGTWLNEFRAVVEDHARKFGAHLLEGALRRGWVRKWPGCAEYGALLCKDLQNV